VLRLEQTTAMGEQGVSFFFDSAGKLLEFLCWEEGDE